MNDPTDPTDRGVSRRRLLLGGATGLGTAAVASAGAAAALALDRDAPLPAAAVAPPARVAFDGLHQAGVATPPQAHLTLLALDVPDPVDTAAVRDLLGRWTRRARAATQGHAGWDSTQMTQGAGPSRLTATVGLGGSLLDRMGVARPTALADLPAFAGDQLIERFCHGDLVVQLCGDDPLVVAAAERVLRREARGVAAVRWQVTGFLGTGTRPGTNGRNLMGQIDGTDNAAVSQAGTGGVAWVDETDQPWMHGGTYLVVRRIRMHLDRWEDLAAPAQDAALGRHIATGAPLGGRQESDPVDLAALDEHGAPRIPLNAHIRLAAPRRGTDEAMLRRSYSYRAGEDEQGEDAGLLFLAYTADPRSSFVPVQRRLAESDALGAFTTATSSALFAVLPGTGGPDRALGQDLLT